MYYDVHLVCMFMFISQYPVLNKTFQVGVEWILWAIDIFLSASNFLEKLFLFMKTQSSSQAEWYPPHSNMNKYYIADSSVK